MSSLHLLYQASTSLPPSPPSLPLFLPPLPPFPPISKIIQTQPIVNVNVSKIEKIEKKDEKEYNLMISIYIEIFNEVRKNYKVYFNPMFSFQKNIKKILSKGLENGKKIECVRHSFENILFDIVEQQGIDSPIYVMLRKWFIPYFSQHMKYYEEYVREIYKNIFTSTLRDKEKAKIREIYDKCCVYGYYPFIKEYQDLLVKK